MNDAMEYSERSKNKYEHPKVFQMPQTRSKAKNQRRVQVDDDDDDSSATGSSIHHDKIEVSSSVSFNLFTSYFCV